MSLDNNQKSNKTTWIVLGVIAGVVILVLIIAGLVIAGRDSESTNSSTQTCTNPQIKGNISQSGEKIYHKPGDMYYSQTEINESAGERMFCTEKDAQDAGWRHSKV